MTTVSTRARERTDIPSEGCLSEGLRRCLATGTMRPRAAMVRFVLGPDARVVPDLAAKLPGPGLWVTATADAIRTAAAKNLFAKAAKTTAHASLSLAEDVTALLRQRCLDLLGLAKGAGIAVLGEVPTEAALRAGSLALYLHAPDATRALDNRGAVPEHSCFSREAMGAAFGYAQIVYAGLAPHGLTQKLMLEINRFQSMTLSGPLLGKNEG